VLEHLVNAISFGKGYRWQLERARMLLAQLEARDAAREGRS
jgi:hypothetical protein